MSETSYLIPGNYIIKYDRIETFWDDYSIPLNGEFVKPEVTGYDAFGRTYTIPSNQITCTGYDMTTAGWQTVTVSYTNPDNTIITTTFDLHVFDYATRITLGEGSTNIELKNDGKIYVDDVASTYSEGQSAYTCPITSENFEKYIGYNPEATRGLRISYILNSQYSTLNEFKILNENGYNHENIEGATMGQYNYQTNSKDITSGVNCSRNIGLNKKLYTGTYIKQALAGTIGPSGIGDNAVQGHIVSATSSDDSNYTDAHFVYGGTGYGALTGQSITITKIEVIE